MEATPNTPPRYLTYVRLGDIRPATTNAKRHDLPGIVASLVEHGIMDPPAVDERTGRLIGGHGRDEALVHMRGHGDPPPEGVIVDDDGEWLIPVYRGWASKSDVHARAAAIALNRLPMSGGWDHKQLAVELEEIHAVDVGLFEGLGFEVEELEDLFRVLPDPTDPDADPLPPKPRLEESPPAQVECPECGHRWPA